MSFSKTQLRKLGDRIRKEDHKGILPEDLDQLEAYRISYKEIISPIFNDLHPVAQSIRNDVITTYRIKRIESIISKLYRLRDIELDRIWDIAGCRCILKNQEHVYKLCDLLEKKFHIHRKRDYYKEPSPDGYKSIHLYLTKTKDDKWPIEVQIRALQEHNWATLVEIVDQLYGMSLKSGQKHDTFENFFKLLSKLNELNDDEKYNLLRLAHQERVFQKLYSVFVHNYLKIRKMWLELNKPKNHFFFVIEVIDDTPNIESFNDFQQAEKTYFEKYTKSGGSNIVLTYLPQANFENLESAYSNYTLTTHTFIDDYFRLLSDVSGYLLSQNRFREFYNLFRNAQENFYSNILNIRLEQKFIQNVSAEKRSKAKYWNKDFKKRLSKRVELLQQLTKKIEANSPVKGLRQVVFSFYVWRINRREERFRKKYSEII